ncbi:MAG TPA: RpiB/LacA/LacB family sugar-phosphate isomerase [Gemmataceae bacterium]|nr:RpiB/LacA/LacB family sugar-phosphate isomerase [Gemmataceae bacterium]
MNGNEQTVTGWGYAVEGRPSTMLQIALRGVHRNEHSPQLLPECNGETCEWMRNVAECLRSGRCRTAVLFCRDACLACCIANKVPGVRAAAVGTVAQAARALAQLGANLLVVEMADRTYFECKEMLRLCCEGADCPPSVACILQELDGHAHR